QSSGTITMTLTRRDCLKYMGSMGLALVTGPRCRSLSGKPVAFVDVARAAGITFEHDNAASPEKFLIETMGSGCGWIDYDQDGLLDLYLVNGAATQAYKPARPLRSALYHNNVDGTFSDVTQRAGVGAECVATVIQTISIPKRQAFITITAMAHSQT